MPNLVDALVHEHTQLIGTMAQVTWHLQEQDTRGVRRALRALDDELTLHLDATITELPAVLYAAAERHGAPYLVQLARRIPEEVHQLSLFYATYFREWTAAGVDLRSFPPEWRQMLDRMVWRIQHEEALVFPFLREDSPSALIAAPR